jgi:hypothetical protein
MRANKAHPTKRAHTAGAPYSPAGPDSSSDEICINYNKDTCNYPSCRYTHACMISEGPHPATQCSQKQGAPLGQHISRRQEGPTKPLTHKGTTPHRLWSPQLEFPFTLTGTCQPNVGNRGPLLVSGWDHWLRNDPNPGRRNTIIDIICDRAFIGYTRPPQFILIENLQSAHNDPTSITKDIEKRPSTSQILRLTTLPAKYIASPFELAPKQDGTWRRTHHLSSPSGHSVNDHIPQAWGTLTYRGFNNAVAAVQACGPGAILIKRDLADAFRNLPVHHDNLWLLRFGWMGTWWCDQFLLFSCRTSPAIFNLFASALEWILQTQQCWDHTLHYLNDFLAIFPHSAIVSDEPNRYEGDLSQLCNDLRFRVKEENNEEGHSIRFLGKEFDTKAMEARLPHDKHDKATALVNSTIAQHPVTHRSLEMTMGFLSFTSKLVQASRPFLRRAYDAVPVTSRTHHIGVSSEIKTHLSLVAHVPPAMEQSPTPTPPTANLTAMDRRI